MTEDEMIGWQHPHNEMGWNKLLEIEKDKKLWCAVVHGVAKSQT